ncbi:DUF1800 domain-containing protein [Xanthocytophaga agilis]|uniref:DUF1800 domain-containing protein n=1 Tax=Xanthocytophaga agilis TaxID=3048010 RepID=A0AAE3UGN1_9BACT|nr:DUF1800 domain-containing protein [Xanthocytophaga agilis]MDJ1501768.1 DUF1800 domain-containing protein [Xanthocytophaga agilis]
MSDSIYWNESSPSIELIALNRMGYGHTPSELERVRQLGFKNYVEEQLYPNENQDTVVLQKLSFTRLHIGYTHKGNKVAEDRPLQYLQSSIPQLWKLIQSGDKLSYEEKIRPLQEVRAATWLRAVYSKWQLREVLTDFWHNHFNVNAAKEERIAATFPVYDREVIRKNCLGNFRIFLEDVAKSTAMQYYLDNVSSKASPANENYARELFELHTLGASYYYNHLYNRWKEVPGALTGSPVGYIDEDVYEAARAFTGWTVANGSDNGKGEHFPDTGTFLYYEGWHDHYQKRILGTELPPNQPPLADGQKVLDLVAFHPATALHICTKLCQRLIADQPTKDTIQQAVRVWNENQQQPDQIRRVVRTILLSEEFAKSWGRKIKRPNELVASFLRATQTDFIPDASFLWASSQIGYHLFEWPTPNGHPDTGTYWLNSQMMLARWRIMEVMFQDWFKSCKINWQQLPSVTNLTARQIADQYLKQITGRTISDKTQEVVANFLAVGGSIDEPPIGNTEEIQSRLKNTISLIGMLPEFQIR